MKELRGNLWTLPADARCITTNGYVTKAGRAVMGRGCALEAKTQFPGIDVLLAHEIQKNGNHVAPLVAPNNEMIWSFPVKHHWRQKADLELIFRSACELMDIVDEWKYENILLPRPGCGNGQLNWEDVKLVLDPILDDRVAVVTF